MRTEILDKWYENLRDGKYTPAQDVLCMNECYCGTGVLCQMLTDLGILKKIPGYETPQGVRMAYLHPIDPESKRATVAPPQVRDYLAEMDRDDSELVDNILSGVMRANDECVDLAMAHQAAAGKLLQFLNKTKGSKYYNEPATSVAV
jgi:hypothetical protein